ncbi:response regulator [Rhizobium helianthi]|uniref:Response regulator n=1 Tax=Rhizobium helianthi TaxID=1132695 RepID=A0ABW4M824_9HYPH
MKSATAAATKRAQFGGFNFESECVDAISPPSRQTILVLEDDMLLALDMEDYLLNRGFYVQGPYARIDDALRDIPSSKLAGAIVDLNLNGEFSFPVIELLKSVQVPVIVCSGYAELPELKARLKGVPMLAKPWCPQKLDSLVREIFLIPNMTRA